jgi:hypothetical protein
VPPKQSSPIAPRGRIISLSGSKTNAEVLSNGAPMLLIKSIWETEGRTVQMFVVSDGP